MKGNKSRSRWDCKPCKKVSFGSEARALDTLKWAETLGTGHAPRRAYPCPYNNGWHLTSKERGGPS